MKKKEVNFEVDEDIEIQDTEHITENDITNPFSTKDIKVTNAVISLSSLLSRLEHHEIDLNPDFQRNELLWNRTKMSRLIESIILKLPLPVFYFDVSDPDQWVVVDGLQRLSTLKKFIIDGKLKLHDMEFLINLNGKDYKELDRSLKRIIDETQIVTYQIEAQTPKEVRYSIFNRINTGGLSLNAQEIRQALNQKGIGVKFLKDICESKEFKRIVGVSSQRMLDRELALRFIAFKLTNYRDIGFNRMGAFLDNTMGKLDLIKDEKILIKLKTELLQTLIFAEEVLGKNHRFSRAIASINTTKTINRSLFDIITVCFSQIEDKSAFLIKKESFLLKFLTLLEDGKSGFSRSITEGTSGRNAIEFRFNQMEEIINEVLNENK